MPPTLQHQITQLHNSLEDLKTERASDNADFERRLKMLERLLGQSTHSAGEADVQELKNERVDMERRLESLEHGPDVQASLQEIKVDRQRDLAQIERRLKALEERGSTAAAAMAVPAAAAVAPDWQAAENDRARDRVVVERRLQALEERSAMAAADPPKPADPPDDKPFDAVEDQFEYQIGSTIWEAMALIGLPQLGTGNSIFLGVAMILNAAVQLYLCIVLLSSPTFSSVGKFKDELELSERWRYSVGHQVENMDAHGTSLVARVCGGDASVSVASNQVALLGEINEYMDLEAADLEGGGVGTGPLLCGVCILLFTVLILREFRQMVMAALAVSSIERGDTQVQEDGTYRSVSIARWASFLAMCLVRAGVASALLVAGVLWLSSTKSITSLILNAAALGFILDLDELMEQTMVPTKVLSFVRTLKPVPFQRPRWLLESIVPLVLSVVVAVLCILLLVVPNTTDMLAVKTALCQGDVDFVATKTPSGYVVATHTTSFNPDEPFVTGKADEDILIKAVHELIYFEAGGSVSYSQRQFNEEDFSRASSLTLAELAETSVCANQDTYGGGIAVNASPAMYMAIRQSTGIHAGDLIAKEPWTCQEHEYWCDTNGLLRNRCPITCGCADPLSGQVLFGAQWGCPAACGTPHSAVMENLSCQDQSTDDSEAWARYWNGYAAQLARKSPDNAVLIGAFAKEMIEGGCAVLKPDPLLGYDICNQQASYLMSNGFGSVLPFCPNTCCKNNASRPAACESICP